MNNTITSITTGTTSESEFRALTPFEAPKPELPNFNPDWLPKDYRDFALAVSEKAQANPDIACISLLSAVSGAAQHLFEVNLVDSAFVNTNLYLMIAAKPGTRKSTVYSQVIRPFDYYEMLNPGISLTASDATYEELVRILSRNRKLFMASSDAGLLDNFHRKGKALDVYLKSYGDNEKITRDTVSRGSFRVSNPSMAVLIMSQTDAADDFICNKNLSGRGLLSRFLYSYPNSRKDRKFCAPSIPDALQDTYMDNILELLGEYYPDMEKGQIMLSTEARALMEEYFFIVERGKETGKLGLLGEWTERQMTNLAKIAGILQIMEYGIVAADYEVSEQTMRNAREIMDYFTAHAFYAFASMRGYENEAKKSARYLMKHLNILTANGESVSKRTLLQKCKGHFHYTEDAEAGLRELVKRGYITISTQKSEGPGRPSEVITVSRELRLEEIA